MGAAFALAAAGRGTGAGVAAALGADDADDPADGSGVMMLTGGIDADEGNSALVGFPVGTDDGSPVKTAAALVGKVEPFSVAATGAPPHVAA